MKRSASTLNDCGQPYAVESKAAGQPGNSFGRRLVRGVCFVIAGALVGAVAGYLLFAMLCIGWDGLTSGWQSPSRGSGGDPIDGWASGIVRMLLAAPIVIAGGVGGIVSGIRLAFSKAQMLREQKLAQVLLPAWRIAFRPANAWAQAGVVLGLVVIAGWLLRLTRPPEDWIGVILIAQLILTLAGGLCSAIGLRQLQKGRAILGAMTAIINLGVACCILY